jgi:hypothetical protein
MLVLLWRLAIWSQVQGYLHHAWPGLPSWSILGNTVSSSDYSSCNLAISEEKVERSNRYSMYDHRRAHVEGVQLQATMASKPTCEYKWCTYWWQIGFKGGVHSNLGSTELAFLPSFPSKTASTRQVWVCSLSLVIKHDSLGYDTSI